MLARLTVLTTLLALSAGCLPCPRTAALQEFEAKTWTQWRSLFDGSTLSGWHSEGKQSVNPGWAVQDGAIARVGEGAGTLVTNESFADFDLYFEWKVAPASNSGIFFWVNEREPNGIITSPEYQILDNARHADGKNPKTSAASNYALNVPVGAVTKPVGQWNEGRITVYRNQVTHVLNGVKVVEYELGSDYWKSLVANSKFNQWPTYGTRRSGNIALQDHGDPVWYRNVQIRTVKPGAE